MIMSEAFADFRRFEDQLDLNIGDTYAGFDAVAEEGYTGTAIVPTYASWTVRTEFELNFGLPVRSLNDPNMPQRLLLDRAQPTLRPIIRTGAIQLPMYTRLWVPSTAEKEFMQISALIS